MIYQIVMGILMLCIVCIGVFVAIIEGKLIFDDLKQNP